MFDLHLVPISYWRGGSGSELIPQPTKSKVSDQNSHQDRGGKDRRKFTIGLEKCQPKRKCNGH